MEAIVAKVCGLERRARVYSALGDPLRLAIVDRLILADAAPGDLGRALGISTNLLAHHLRVLEEAGVIRRRRSEGDQRRAYVQLHLDDPIVGALGLRDDGSAEPKALADLGLGELASAARVVFVCTHNSARSQLAAAVWTGLSRTPTASAGTHPAGRIHPRAVAAARRHGLPPLKAKPTHADQVLRKDDLLVAVCDNAHEELGASEEMVKDGAAGTWPRLHWSVPDPVRVDTDEAFEAAYQDIVIRVDRLAHAMNRKHARHRTAPRTPTRRTP